MEAPMVKMVDMPTKYLRWVLAQDKEDYRVPTLDDYTPEEVAESSTEAILAAIGSLQTAYDEFDEFRAWVRGALDMDGLVMVSRDVISSDPQEWQEIVDREWEGAQEELDVAMKKKKGPLGPHTYKLSTYLSLMYQYAAPVPMFWGS